MLNIIRKPFRKSVPKSVIATPVTATGDQALSRLRRRCYERHDLPGKMYRFYSSNNPICCLDRDRFRTEIRERNPLLLNDRVFLDYYILGMEVLQKRQERFVGAPDPLLGFCVFLFPLPGGEANLLGTVHHVEIFDQVDFVMKQYSSWRPGDKAKWGC